MPVPFINNLPCSSEPESGHRHSHGHEEHGHTHEHLDHAGHSLTLPLRSSRNNLYEQGNTRNVICLTIRPVTLRKGASQLALEGSLNKVALSLTLTHL